MLYGKEVNGVFLPYAHQVETKGQRVHKVDVSLRNDYGTNPLRVVFTRNNKVVGDERHYTPTYSSIGRLWNTLYPRQPHAYYYSNMISLTYYV